MAAILPHTLPAEQETPKSQHVDAEWLREMAATTTPATFDDVNKHWVQESAAIALLRLCSRVHKTGSEAGCNNVTPVYGQCVKIQAPAQHRDARIAPALCCVAARRALAPDAPLSSIRSMLTNAREAWRQGMEKAMETAPEPWLKDGADSMVDWYLNNWLYLLCMHRRGYLYKVANRFARVYITYHVLHVCMTLLWQATNLSWYIVVSTLPSRFQVLHTRWQQ
eukprot:SAG22_NODE_556_length_9120_cov_2.272475_2_plen_223_part_00